jgi:hypothetical protein
MKRVGILILVFLVCGSAHGLTLLQLRNRVDDKLGQATASTSTHWTSATLDNWINDAVQTVSKMGLCYTRDTTFALDTGKTEYTMPADYIMTKEIILGAKQTQLVFTRSPFGGVLVPGSQMGKEAGASSPYPSQWQDKGESIRKLRCTPSPRIIDSVTVTYYAYGRNLSGDTAQCDLPSAYQRLVPVLAASSAWSKTRTGNPYWQEFVDQLSAMIQRDQSAAGGDVQPKSVTAGQP